MNPNVKAFFDKETWTLTYVVYDEKSKDAVIIDSVWNYEPFGSKLSTRSFDEQIQFIEENHLIPHYSLETHAHADHLTACQLYKKKYPKLKDGIGIHIKKVQSVFKSVFNLQNDFKSDGSQFDLLLEEGKPIQGGTLTIQTFFTPGHTPACCSFLIGNALFTGDALFMPDYGTGRCDFPSGSAEDLYHSVHNKLYSLPDSTRVFVGHDYQPNGRALAYESSIGEEKKSNIHLKAQTTKEEYVTFRKNRDATLSAPRLLFPSIQINMNGGILFQPENNGVSYLKIPIR